MAAEPQPAAELIALCARLPLALGVAAGRAATRPGFSLAALAAELRDTRNRLEALDAGDAATDVRAVLSWSYEQLSDPAARMFRLLGLHPGPDVSVAAAASLAGVAQPEAAAALRELTRTHMVAEHQPGRYAFHDLLRAYAFQQAEAADSAADRAAAARRCLDHYLHTAHAGAVQINRVRKPIDLPAPEPGTAPEEFSGRTQALAWFDAESPILLNLLAHAVSGGDDSAVWPLVWTLAPFLYRRGRFHECISIQRQSLRAAQRLGNPVGIGHAHYELGRGLVSIGNFSEAEPNLSRALDLFGQLGDRANEATVHQGFGHLFEQQGRYAQSLVHAREALRVVREIGPAQTAASIENSVGWLYAHLGQCEEALDVLPALAEVPARDRPSRRRGRHLGQPRVHPQPDAGLRAGGRVLLAGGGGLPRDRRPVPRGRFAHRPGRRSAARGGPRGRPHQLGAGTGHPGEHPAPGRRAGPRPAEPARLLAFRAAGGHPGGVRRRARGARRRRGACAGAPAAGAPAAAAPARRARRCRACRRAPRPERARA